MSSIWKDLLFLHGHLLHRQDLEWAAETAPAQDATTAPLSQPTPAPATSSHDCGAAACA
jgi:hypothetical protein